MRKNWKKENDMALKNLVVKQDPKNEIPVEIMAQAIVDVQNGMNAINKSRASRAMIVALIKDKSGLTKGVIELVLNNLDAIEKTWLKPSRS